MTRWSRFSRGLALVLCLCLTAPYLPVPGHAEGCGHVHGEECYREVTQCVHTHGEDCWSDPEAKDAGEEPDVCAHVCGEDTGCVTKELHCAHVHDDTCGEQLREEPEPEQEEPKDEEPKSEEMKSEEPKNEAPKQEEENQPLVISQWEWVDEEAVLDPETGVLCLSAEEPILFEQVVELLPKAILATVGEETQTVPLDHWDPKDYPQETGANSGSYLLEASLPEGYALAQDAAPLTVPLEFAQAQTLADCGHENVDMDTGKCQDCDEQVYVAKIGDVGYATLEEALVAAQTDENKNCTVTVLCEKNYDGWWNINKGVFTLDLNKTNNILGVYLYGGELTIRNGGMRLSNIPIMMNNGTLRIESGTYTGGTGSLAYSGGTILISGGEFIMGIESRAHKPIADVLVDGKAFFSDPECEQLKDASGTYLGGPLYVGPHTEENYTLRQDGTYKCDCGRICDHTKANMETGKCLCGKKQVYGAKIGDTGYTTLWDALDAAQEMQNACTVTLLCDVTFSKPYTMDKGTVRLDLNGNSFRSDEGFDINGGSLTLQGGLMLTALQVNDGTLCIESGQYQGSLTRNGGEVILSGGTFMGGMKMQNMRRFPVADFLANGTAFYDDFVNPSELIDASSDSLTNYVTYSIRTHTDTYSSTTGKCPCGRTCKHADVDMTTGKCATCQKQLYVAKIGDTGYATLDAALEDAQQAENEGCTVTVLADVDTICMVFNKGRLTLDLNGKTIKISDVLNIMNGADLTITDSAPGGSRGKIIPLSASSNEHVSFILRSGKLKLAGGYFDINLNVTQEGDGAKNTLTITDGYVYGIDLKAEASVDISGGEFGHIDDYIGIKHIISGGTVVDYIQGNETVIALLKDGYALYSDQNRENIVDASSTLVFGKPENRVLYVLPHAEDYNATTGKCPCGRTIPQATLSVAPTANTLTYDGTDQSLVTAGTAQNGRLLYSLEENGTYGTAVPTGRQADTYTVWYYVEGEVGKYYNTEKQSLTVTVGKKDLTPVVAIPDRDFDGTKEVTVATVTLNGKVDGDDLTYTLGTLEFDYALPGTRTAKLTGTPKLEGKDAGNYNLKAPTGLTGTVNATDRYLDVTASLPNADSVTVDGEEYPVTTENGKRYVNLPAEGTLLTTYTYQTNEDGKTYPDTMQVFAIDRQNTGSTLTEIPEFEDLLLYEGCSIRLNGTKGIRMITSIDQTKKKQLISADGLAGYTLVEYGTVITRESTLGGKTLNLDNVPSNNYNYAYSKANKKDPVFKTENGRIQYTNVLIGFQPADYKTELVLRPYIKLRDTGGNEVVLYGGTVTRSIYYIAQQNIDEYKPGSVGYKYLEKILNGQA